MKYSKKLRLAAVAVFLSLLAGVTGAAAREGGSHVGNIIGVDAGIGAYVPRGAMLSRKGSVIYDDRLKEAILRVSTVSRSKFIGKAGVVKARLGSVEAYEVLTEKDDLNGKPRWMVCRTANSESCTLLTPISDENPLVPAMIGTLVKIALPK